MPTTNCNVKFDKIYDVYCGRGQGVKIDPLACSIGEKGWLGNPVAVGRRCPVCHTDIMIKYLDQE